MSGKTLEFYRQPPIVCWDTNGCKSAALSEYSHAPAARQSTTAKNLLLLERMHDCAADHEYEFFAHLKFDNLFAFRDINNVWFAGKGGLPDGYEYSRLLFGVLGDKIKSF